MDMSIRYSVRLEYARRGGEQGACKIEGAIIGMKRGQAFIPPAPQSPDGGLVRLTYKIQNPGRDDEESSFRVSAFP